MPSKLNTFRAIRSSKFRHVYGQAARKEKCYEYVISSQKIHDAAACAHCTVNPKFIAIVVEVDGGGAFIVLPLEQTGRIDPNTPKVAGHGGPINDLKWSPFNDNLIASASDDCTVKLWHIPDNGLRNTAIEPLVDLRAHRRRVMIVEWHPTVESVLFTAGHDFTIVVWDINKGGRPLRTILGHSDAILSMSLNRNGSRLATTCRDKKLRVIEPRTGDVLLERVCHEGPKASKCVYLGDSGLVLTTGFSRFSDRQISIWSDSADSESCSLKTETVDSSSGVLTPYYDHDTNIVYVAGKGDGNIRYYDISSTQPFVQYLGQYVSSEPQRSFCIMTKRGCEVSRCEIFRFYKLTKTLCEPVSMIVPRQSDQFQPDIYPDTAAPTPTLSVDQWMDGMNKAPALMSMKTGVIVKTHRPVPLPRAPNDCPADRNADKKLAFLWSETRPDYRPTQWRDSKELKRNANLDTQLEVTLTKHSLGDSVQTHNKTDKTHLNENNSVENNNLIATSEETGIDLLANQRDELERLRREIEEKDQSIRNLEVLVRKGNN